MILHSILQYYIPHHYIPHHSYIYTVLLHHPPSSLMLTRIQYFFIHSNCRNFGYTSQFIYPGDNSKFAAQFMFLYTHTKYHLYDHTQ